jgi:hypothetical protein
MSQKPPPPPRRRPSQHPAQQSSAAHRQANKGTDRTIFAVVAALVCLSLLLFLLVVGIGVAFTAGMFAGHRQQQMAENDSSAIPREASSAEGQDRGGSRGRTKPKDDRANGHDSDGTGSSGTDSGTEKPVDGSADRSTSSAVATGGSGSGGTDSGNGKSDERTLTPATGKSGDDAGSGAKQGQGTSDRSSLNEPSSAATGVNQENSTSTSDGVRHHEYDRHGELFGAPAIGKRVLYLLECSTRMEGQRFVTADSGLKTSLRSLSSNQDFLIIVFADDCYPMFFPRILDDLVPCTDENQRLVADWLSEQERDVIGKPNAALALTKALTYKPTTIFFISGGGVEEHVLADVKHANKNGIVIHAVGIGVSDLDQSLGTLAKQNGGVYRAIKTSD